MEEAAVPDLSVAFAHPALSSDPSILCAAAPVCKAWRGAVQQCGACNTAVQVSLGASLSRVRSFAQWFQKHAVLVKCMTIKTPPVSNLPKQIKDLPLRLHLAATKQQLQQAMQLVEAPPAAEQNATAVQQQQQQQQQQHQQHQQQQQQQQCVRLPSISSVTMYRSTGLLAALPAHSLTHLDLTDYQCAEDGPAVSAALARLSNLQRLRVTLHHAPYSCLAGVAQLTRLTFLRVAGFWSGSEEPLQQLLAQPLPLGVLRLTIQSRKLPLLDPSRLTQLQELHCMSVPDAVLPSQLQQLTLHDVSSDTLQAVMQLQELRRLTLAFQGDGGHADVSCLALLPALQQLVLSYWNWQPAAAAAAAWSQLPQLSELVVNATGVGRQEWQAIVSGVAASTSLTKLELTAFIRPTNDDGEGEAGVGTWNAPCAKLAGLTNLQDLYLATDVLSPGDALALTALTGLTCLFMNGAGVGVGDLAATVLADSCKQLRSLILSDCSLVSMACLATVRHLTQLTELRLWGDSEITQQGLMLLTGLTILQFLGVEVTREVNNSFWAAVRGQQL